MTPALETARLLLRPLELADAEHDRVVEYSALGSTRTGQAMMLSGPGQ